MTFEEGLSQQITAATGARFELNSIRQTTGGCINRTAVVSAHDGRRYFVKWNDAPRLSMFEAEALGLRELAQTGVIRVPRPICTGSAGAQVFLVLEYLALVGADAGTHEQLGQQLASLHRVQAPQFGWQRDNTIGSTPQANAWSNDWVEFLRERRLGFQLNLAADRNVERLRQRGGELLERLPCFFTSYRPPASLLHGDLWSGNIASTDKSVPVVFDPAVYYGDREADLAMTELFGGFSPRFYRAYGESWPLDAGYRTRKTLYNLYHVLNHFNLFGGGYGHQAEQMVQQLLSEAR